MEHGCPWDFVLVFRTADRTLYVVTMTAYPYIIPFIIHDNFDGNVAIGHVNNRIFDVGYYRH